MIILLPGSNMEHFTIIIVSFHRDHLPSGWQTNTKIEYFYTLSWLLMALVIEWIFIFSVLVVITKLVKKIILKHINNDV